MHKDTNGKTSFLRKGEELIVKKCLLNLQIINDSEIP
jgi:hypothetical protein